MLLQAIIDVILLGLTSDGSYTSRFQVVRAIWAIYSSQRGAYSPYMTTKHTTIYTYLLKDFNATAYKGASGFEMSL